jgi:biotin operon repressor
MSDRNIKKIQMEAKLLLTLNDNPSVSDESLSRTLDTSIRTVQRSINKLRNSGVLNIKNTKFQLGGNWVNTRFVEVIR